MFLCEHGKGIISTHSLTRRLTLSDDAKHEGSDISTHSLTRRLTKISVKKRLLSRNFNSQPHKEADRSVTGARRW